MMSSVQRLLYLNKWQSLTNKKNSCVECMLFLNMNTKTKPLLSIISSIMITQNCIKKESPKSWKLMQIEKKSLNIKRSKEFSNNNKISPSRLKKVPKFSQISKIKTKSHIIPIFYKISLKAHSLSINKQTIHKFSNLCVKKSIKLLQINLYHH